MKVIKIKSVFFDYLLFFIVGLYVKLFVFLYLPLWAVYFLCKNPKFVPKKSFVYVFTPFFLYFFLMFLGVDYLYLSNPPLVLLSYIIIFFILGYVFSLQSEEQKIKSMAFLFMGMLLNVYIAVIYSYIYISSYSGYGFIYSPIAGEYVNSPGYSLTLALGTCFFTAMLFIFKHKTTKALIYGSLILNVYFALYLGGRAFFILYPTFLLALFLFKAGDFIAAAKHAFVFFLLIAGLWMLINTFTPDVIDLISSRFARGIGSSARFDLWVDGFNKMQSYPLGGFEVDRSIDNVRFFHNFWIDTARILGWLPVFFLVAVNIYSLSKGLLNFKSKNVNTIILLNIVCLALMAQDVVLEGLWRILLFYYLTCIYLTTSYSYKKTNLISLRR